jgi:hypothetical protein
MNHDPHNPRTTRAILFATASIYLWLITAAQLGVTL